MKLPTFLVAVAALFFVHSEANACGPESDADAVSAVVTEHFAAVKAHDRTRILAAWVSDGQMTASNTTESIDVAATNLGNQKSELTEATIFGVTVHGRTATVLTRFTYFNQQFQDAMTLEMDDARSWHISSEVAITSGYRTTESYGADPLMLEKILRRSVPDLVPGA